MADLAVAIKIATEDASSGPIGKIKGALGGLGAAISAPTRALGGLVSGLGSLGLAAAGVGAAFDAVKGVGSALGLGALNEMEQTRASFNAFTKDAELTERIMADVRKEAALTPFAFGEMAKATASLMPVAKSSGAALMDLVKEAEILAASNPLEGLEGASFSLREAMTGDFTSIVERFNLSRSTINKLKAEGVPNLEIVRRAMREMGFDSDLIAAKAETLEGRWSTFLDTLTTLQTKIGQPIFDALKEGLSAVQPLLEENMATFEGLADLVAGGLKSGIETAKTAIGGLVDAWTDLSTGFRDGGIVGVLQEVGPMLRVALADLGALIVTNVEQWATDFAAWVDGADAGMMGGLAEMWTGFAAWMQETGFAIVEKLVQWGAAFVDWIGPKIPGMLEALGGFYAEMVGWIVGTGLPNLILKLGEWGTAIVDWVRPRIPPLLLALGELLVRLSFWIADVALPAIVSKLLEWGAAFVEWVPGAIIGLLFELGKLEVEFIGWIASKVKDLAVAALDLGTGLVGGIRDGIASALSGFWSWLQSSFVDKIPSFVRELLNINSPSGVFMDIGRNIVEGLRVGMESRLPSIEDVVSRLTGTIAMTGEVTDWLRAAMHVAGVGGDWLPGLQRLAQWESTGNPRAVNPTSVGGQHATGLMQTLPSTFRGYALPGMGDIFNPVHNAAAAIRYILATYGTVYEIPGVASGDRSRFPGYATGGIAWQPQLAYLAEREPELIVPLSRVRAGGGNVGQGDLAGLARAIVKGINATRPINLVGTAEELARQVRREMRAEEHDIGLLRGAR